MKYVAVKSAKSLPWWKVLFIEGADDTVGTVVSVDAGSSATCPCFIYRGSGNIDMIISENRGTVC